MSPRRSTMKPKLSPAAASARARTVTPSRSLPPGGIVTCGSGSTVAPADAACGSNSTDHVPAPPPASSSWVASARVCGPRLTSMSPNDKRHGGGEEVGLVGTNDVDEAAALQHDRRLLRASGVAPRRPCRGDERGARLPRRPRRVRLEQQRGSARDVRRRHARPVEDRERGAAPGRLRRRRREDLAAGRRDVRLERVAEVRRRSRREARDDAAPPGDDLDRPAARRDDRPAALLREVGAEALAVEVGDHRRRNRELERDRVGLAEAVVGQDQPDRAGGLRALRLREEGARAARRERDHPGERARRERVRARVVRVEAETAELARPPVVRCAP